MSFADKENMPPISLELFNCIRMTLTKGSTILELGSGPGSTVELRKCGYDIWSIEHNPDHMTFNKSDRYIFCPVEDYKFYNLNKLSQPIPKYQALLIDGPDTNDRMIGFNNNYDFFDSKVHWFIDDYGYPPMKESINTLAVLTNRELLKFEVGAKHFAVLLGDGL